jgi:hypothetical protein
MQVWDQKMRRLTVDLSIWSLTTIVDGGGRSFADSGEHLRRRTAKFAQLRDPLHDSTHLDDLQNKAVLLDHAKDSGVAPIGGSGWTPANFLRLAGDRREEVERDWESLGKIWDGLGFPGGHLRGFIDQGVVDIEVTAVDDGQDLAAV